MSTAYAIALDADVLDVLQHSVMTDTSLTLPPGQLDRKLYERVNKVLEAAGGKWNRKAKAHVFPNGPQTALGLTMTAGSIIDEKKAKQQFFTPDALATMLVQKAGVMSHHTVLEPSAGDCAC